MLLGQLAGKVENLIVRNTRLCGVISAQAVYCPHGVKEVAANN
jgi:hypothetical protein